MLKLHQSFKEQLFVGLKFELVAVVALELPRAIVFVTSSFSSHQMPPNCRDLNLQVKIKAAKVCSRYTVRGGIGMYTYFY